MSKKRLSLDLDLDNYNDKKIWDYLETKKVKSKAIKSILNAFLDDVDISKERLYDKEEVIKEKEESLKVSEIDPSGISGF